MGKTTLLNSVLKHANKKNNKKNIITSIGFDFYPLNIKYGDIIIKLNICKPNDDEKYHSLINNYYKNCDLVILVFAIDE